jgi:hypothetical protein
MNRTDFISRPCTAFAGARRIASGPLVDVALAVRDAAADGVAVLTFDDATGGVIDLDLRGTAADIVSRLNERTRQEDAGGRPDSAVARGRGRPKLGVVAREVTLLPRHWDWLARQPGGASQALRRLVDQARRADGGRTDANVARERAYRFMSAMAGDLPGFEEAVRALFRGDATGLAREMEAWPPDVKAHALVLARAEGGGAR